MKIRGKLISLVLLAALVPSLVTGAVSYFYGRTLMATLIGDELQTAAQETLTSLEEFLDNVLANTVTWSNLFVMQDVLLDDSDGDIQRHLNSLRLIYPYLSEIAIANEKGEIVAALLASNVGRNVRELSLGRQILGKSPTAKHDTSAPREGRMDDAAERFLTNRAQTLAAILKVNHYRGNVEKTALTGDPGMTFAVPIVADYDRDTVIGALITVVDWAELTRIMANRTVAGKSQDADRELLLVNRRTGRVFYQTGQPVDLDQVLADLPTEQGFTQATIGGREFLIGSAASFAGPSHPDPGWMLHAAFSSEVAYAGLQQLNVSLLIFGGVMVVVLVGVGVAGASTVSRPLTMLSDRMLRVTGESSDEKVEPLEREDELGDLSRSFAKMTHDLRVTVQTLNHEIKKREEFAEKLRISTGIAEAANQAKSDFLSSVSHELRTPLNSILGFAQVMTSDPRTPLTEQQELFMSKIVGGGNHLLALIDQILELNKIDQGRVDLSIQQLDPGLAIAECMDLVQPKATEREISMNKPPVPGELPAIRTDPLRLRQILLNLLSNAVKYNRDGGRVTVECWAEDSDRLLVEVSDTGIGIPEELREELFQPFKRLGRENSNIEGTGIGLTITKKLVEMLGGEIGFRGAIDQGSVFWIALPLKPVSSQES